MATAESCTGGWIAKVLTDLPGSSAWFAGGIVSYSNDAKTHLLGVPPAIIASDGAVSEATVRAMAESALGQFGVDVCVAVSGIAGPDGGSKAKPVGTVWIAWATPGVTAARQYRFDGDRGAVRLQTVEAALTGILAL